MEKRNVAKQYTLLRSVQVLTNIVNGILKDYRFRTGLLNITDDVFPFAVEMKDLYQKAESLLQYHVMPQMNPNSITVEEKKVGYIIKAISGKSDLGNHIHKIIDEISEEYGINWIRPGDVITCEYCGKKYIVNRDGSLLDVDDFSDEDIEILQSGNSIICI